MKLNKEKPSHLYKERPTGLYVETKMFEFYQSRGIDSAKMTYDVLAKYGLETIEKSEPIMPIILECFESGSLKRLI